MPLIRKDQFLGINNIAKPERLPEGAVADAVNVDFTVGGKAELRSGYVKVVDSDTITALWAIDESLVYIDDNNLTILKDGLPSVIARLSGINPAATVHNNKLYLNTDREALIINGSSAEQWRIEPPAIQVGFSADNTASLASGTYLIAVTEVINGRESGCVIEQITIPGNCSIDVLTNHTGSKRYRLYCSQANGATLYYQGMIFNEKSLLHKPDDDTERLETANLSSLPYCSQLVSYNGLIVGASKNFVFYTQPLMPHLFNAESNFFVFPSEVTLIASVANGIYVCADKTYFISGIGSNELSQRVIFDFGAVAGTLVNLPGNLVAWFSKYGQVVAGPDGQTNLLNNKTYAPSITKDGAAGFFEHNGNQMIATVMRGSHQNSKLKAGDNWALEVI